MKSETAKRDHAKSSSKMGPDQIVQRTRQLTTEAAELRESARNLRRAAEHAERRARDMAARAEEMRTHATHSCRLWHLQREAV